MLMSIKFCSIIRFLLFFRKMEIAGANVVGLGKRRAGIG